jgi:fatty-acyl-CoA synthase
MKRLTSSIGRLLPTGSRIVDEKEGTALGVGEFVVRGPRIMTGYWGDQEKTSKAIDSEAWLHTNDMGWVDEEVISTFWPCG